MRPAWLLLAASLIAGAAAADPLADGTAARAAGNYDVAMRILLPLANGGNDEAQRIVGEMVFAAQGAPASPAAALAWTRLAADNGNRIGQYNLGYLYETGTGVAKSTDQAIYWYGKSAGQNYALAQRRLGDLYAASDPRLSAYWYNQALRNGDAIALDRYTKAAGNARAIDDARKAELRAESDAKSERERAEYEATRRMEEAARPSGNVFAQGIAEGMAAGRRDSAVTTDARPAPDPAKPSPPARRAAAGPGTGNAASPVILARSGAPNPPASAAVPSAPPARPVFTWPYRLNFTSNKALTNKDEASARQEVQAARTRWENKATMESSPNSIGYSRHRSWRVTNAEPVVCASNPAYDGSRVATCHQRVDYMIVSYEQAPADIVRESVD